MPRSRLAEARCALARAARDDARLFGTAQSLDDAVARLPRALPASASGPRSTWRCVRSTARPFPPGRSRPAARARGRGRPPTAGRAAPAAAACVATVARLRGAASLDARWRSRRPATTRRTMSSSNRRPARAARRFRLATPIGVLVLLRDAENALRVLDWTDHEERMQRLLRRHYGDDGVAIDRRRRRTAHPPCVRSKLLRGRPARARRCRSRAAAATSSAACGAPLRDIPAGTTISYAELARRRRPSVGVPRGRARQRRESDRHRGAIATRRRQRRLADRLRRRHRAQTLAARARGGRRGRASRRRAAPLEPLVRGAGVLPCRHGVPRTTSATATARRVRRPARETTYMSDPRGDGHPAGRRAGLETPMLRRNSEARLRGRHVVVPGGRVDPEDRAGLAPRRSMVPRARGGGASRSMRPGL